MSPFAPPAMESQKPGNPFLPAIKVISIGLALLAVVFIIRLLLSRTAEPLVKYEFFWVENGYLIHPYTSDGSLRSNPIAIFTLTKFALLFTLIYAFILVFTVNNIRANRGRLAALKTVKHSRTVISAVWIAGSTTVILCVVYCVGNWALKQFVFENRDPRLSALLRHEPILGMGTNYIAVGNLNGPEKLKMGFSEEVKLTLWMTNATATTEHMKLLRGELYVARPRLQAPSFELQDSPAHELEKALSVTNSAEWSWVITPKEKHFGQQLILADIFLRAASNKNSSQQVPYLRCVVSVVDPIGLPVWVQYIGLPASGAVLFLLAERIIKGWKWEKQQSKWKRTKKKQIKAGDSPALTASGKTADTKVSDCSRTDAHT
jgi:hypothetical protein